MKNCSAVETEFSLTVLVDTPFAKSLFCGLTLEELETFATLTVDVISSLLIFAKDSIPKID
jgi:hypothetical protein